MGQVRNLTLADGQLGTTVAEIIAGPGDYAKRVHCIFANVGAQEETVVVTIVRAGGTARRLYRVVLQPDQSAEIDGLPLNSADSLKAYTTNAASIDYVVSQAPENVRQTLTVHDEYGIPKTSPQILEQLATVLG